MSVSTPHASPDASEHEPEHALPAPRTQKLLPAHATEDAGQPSRGGNSRGSIWRKLGLLLLLLAIAAIVIYKIRANKAETNAETQKTVAAANRPVPVTVQPVESRTMPIYYTALGTVTPYNSVVIKSRVDGQLLSVNVREGQQVKQGQLLALIDPRPYQAIVAQAEGQLAKDQAAANNNEAEANRYRALYQAGVVSKESEQSQISNSGQSVGTLAADRAAIQAAKVNVAYTRITSPINGVVGLRQVDPGNIVHASDTTGLILVTQLQPISVIFTLPEDQLPQVLKLMRGGHQLVVDALDRNQSKHLANGSLVTVDNQIDTTTGTVKGKAVFNNIDGALFPNQFVNARVILEQRANSLVVPAAAIQSGANGNFVYVVKPCPTSGCPKPAGNEEEGSEGGSGKDGSSGKSAKKSDNQSEAQPKGPQYYVSAQNVMVDLTEGSQVILKGGVQPGDQVVVDGQEKLKINSRVIPKQGRSNAGGPSTQEIGAGGISTPADTSAPGANTTDSNGQPKARPGSSNASGQPGTQGGNQTGSRP